MLQCFAVIGSVFLLLFFFSSVSVGSEVSVGPVLLQFSFSWFSFPPPVLLQFSFSWLSFPPILLQFSLLGVGCASAAVMLYEGVRASEIVLRPLPRWASAPLAGALCGAIAYKFPQVR
jgi:hypothetical protein